MTDSSILAITTTIDFCRNFPREPIPRLPREQLYEVIKKTLEIHRIVILEGEPLSGKTECLADYVRRSPNTCIGIFLNPDLGIFYTPSYVRLVVAEQVSWIVNGTRLQEDVVTEERYLQLLFKLQRHAKHTRITWLIDGLSTGKTGQNIDLSELIRLIPFGMGEFDFVVSGERDISTLLDLRDQKPKAIPIFPVALEEANSYFADLDVKDADIREIRQFSSGIIGRMQKFRDFLCTGVPFETLLHNKNPSLETLFEFEWRLIPQSEEMRRLLAYIVFSNKPVTISDLTGYTNLDAKAVSALIPNCRILTTSIDERLVSIESKAQRSFVRNRLDDLELSVRSYVITSLLERPESNEATMYLPSQLMDAGRHDEVLKYLGPNHFLNLLETERSLHSIRTHAELGIHAAHSLQNPTAELSLSLIRSLATGMTFSIGSDSQIQALVKLGAPESALELASMAPTTEERLHLLAIAANTLHTNKQTIPEDLKDQIRSLQKEISFEDMGELGVEIACNLLPVDFDIAHGVINRVLDGARRRLEKNTDHLPGTQTGLAITESETSAPTGEKRNIELIPEYQARRFGDAIASIVERLSPEQIKAFIRKIEPSNKITILAMWLEKNRVHVDAHSIADLALDLVLGELSRSPRLQDLREVAEILPYIEDDKQRDELTRRIDAQVNLLGHQGTSEEFTRLRLLLLRVRFPIDPEQVELSLICLFSEIDDIKDISVKTTCWTWMLHHLTSFANVAKLETDTFLISEVTAKLSQSIEYLLQCTANHYLAARAAIDALAQTDPDKAFELVGRLNTMNSRDKGYQQLIRSLVLYGTDEIRLRIVRRSIDKIIDDDIRAGAIIGTLRYLVRPMDHECDKPISPEVDKLWTSLRVSSATLQALALTYRLQLREKREAVDISDMTRKLTDIWDLILVDAVKIEIGYLIASELATDEPTVAREWIQQSVDFAKERHIPSETVRNALLTTASLAVRVLPHIDEQCNESFKRMASLIQFMPSCELQLQLWIRLGIKMHYAAKVHTTKAILDDFVMPILNASYTHNELVRDAMIADAAPLLYLVHAASATQAINRIESAEYQDLARNNICAVLFQRCPVDEPFEAPDDHEYPLDQAVVADILAILKDIKADAAILDIVRSLCTSIAADSNKSKITRTAAIDCLTSLKEIINNNLPDLNNIHHKGYLIACHAYILRARASINNAHASKDEWIALYFESRGIDNIADRVVVTAIVGSCAHETKVRGALPDWIDDVRQDLVAIPSDQDRVDRYDWVAKIVRPVDRAACRTLLSDAMKCIVRMPETDDVVKRQRSLLDLASAIDPKLADGLIDLNDTDEARRGRLKKDKMKHDNRLVLASNPSADEVMKMTDQELADVCRDNLGRLASGRIGARAIEDFSMLQQRASKMPIKLASNIWHYIVESAIRKRGRDKNSDFAIKLFDATCKSSEIVCGLIGQFFYGDMRMRTLDVGMVRNGDRDLFLEWLRTWAKTVGNETIKISDPYFGPEDMQIIKTIAQTAENAKFQILTSKEHIRKKVITDVGEAFEDAWRQICDDQMPDTQIAVIGIGNQGKHPIHDRWIVCSDRGLRLGSSAHSMGYVRTSEVSEMNATESRVAYNEIESYFERAPREFNGERLLIAKYAL